MTSQQVFQLDAPEHAVVKNGEVHIWRAYLNQDQSRVKDAFTLLSGEEQERARKYHFQEDRERWVIARAGLRTILSRYIRLPPEKIRFSYNQYGKPSLSCGMGDGLLNFNLAHSGGIALYAVTNSRAVGIDIEYVRDNALNLELAEQFFSPSEVSSLRAVASNLRCEAFYDGWTRKEAFIKASGRGLSYRLHTFTVSLDPDHPPSVLRIDEDPLEAARWTLLNLFAGKNYRAALALKGDAPRLECWQWLG